jgi:hypothetical protein
MQFARIPSGVGAPRGQEMLYLSEKEAEALYHAEDALGEDLRFEHMKPRELDEAVWRFACLAHFRRTGDHVSGFVAEHAEEPEDATCCFPVELLTVDAEREVAGVTIQPAEGMHIPAFVAPEPLPAVTTVACVPCRGTDRGKMTERARERARFALQLVRVGLHDKVDDMELWFRLGTRFWFTDEGAGGWQRRKDDGWPLNFDGGRFEAVASSPVATLPPSGGTRLERCVRRALWWIEQGQLAVDPLVELLFLFIALEAILGDRSEGLKGKQLAVRRAVLGHKTTGHFARPNRLFDLYDQVRSTTTHGEEAPRVPERDFRDFPHDARSAVYEFTQYARAAGFTSRGKLVSSLDDDTARVEIERRFFPLADVVDLAEGPTD